MDGSQRMATNCQRSIGAGSTTDDDDDDDDDDDKSVMIIVIYRFVIKP